MKHFCVVIEISATWSPCKESYSQIYFIYIFQVNHLRIDYFFKILPKISSYMTYNPVGVHCYEVVVIQFREIIAVCCEILMAHINAMLQNTLSDCYKRWYVQLPLGPKRSHFT